MVLMQSTQNGERNYPKAPASPNSRKRRVVLFDVTARQYGNSVSYDVEVLPETSDEAEPYKLALAAAKRQAAVIFDYKGIGDEPRVTVKQAKEQAVGG